MYTYIFYICLLKVLSHLTCSVKTESGPFPRLVRFTWAAVKSVNRTPVSTKQIWFPQAGPDDAKTAQSTSYLSVCGCFSLSPLMLPPVLSPPATLKSLPLLLVMHDGCCSILTLSSRHLFSLMAPRQPRNPVTMTTVPRVMMTLAAESDGKEGDRVAKLPWDTDSHTPTPNSPHPPSWNTHRKLRHFLQI